MNLYEFKEALKTIDTITFVLPNGKAVPPYFHVTEVGKLTREFVDCGGTLRKEESINFQLWESDDYDHRLSPEKLLSIIDMSESTLNLTNLQIEVEYQNDTIGKYQLDFSKGAFQLQSTQTDCLAKDKCDIPLEKKKFDLSDLTANACTPGNGCC